jgi:hypothetical protein
MPALARALRAAMGILSALDRALASASRLVYGLNPAVKAGIRNVCRNSNTPASNVAIHSSAWCSSGTRHPDNNRVRGAATRSIRTNIMGIVSGASSSRTTPTEPAESAAGSAARWLPGLSCRRLQGSKTGSDQPGLFPDASSRTFLAVPARSPRTRGFFKKPLMPNALAFVAVILSLKPVQRITGMSARTESMRCAS